MSNPKRGFLFHGFETGFFPKHAWPLGFSLLELLVSVVLLALVSALIYGAFFQIAKERS